MSLFNNVLSKIKSIFSVSNIRRMFLFLTFVSVCYAIFLLFSPFLPAIVQDKICRISGFGVIVIMVILLFLFFHSLKLVKNFVIKLGLTGCIGMIIMYSLWLTIDYGSKYPFAAATGFNIPEIALGLACSYLLLDKLINHTKNNKRGK